MTPEEIRAKRKWGTAGCQVRKCAAPAVYLVQERWEDESDSGEWWQYCCLHHTEEFAREHGVEIPAVHTEPEVQPAEAAS